MKEYIYLKKFIDIKKLQAQISIKSGDSFSECLISLLNNKEELDKLFDKSEFNLAWQSVLIKQLYEDETFLNELKSKIIGLDLDKKIDHVENIETKLFQSINQAVEYHNP